MIDAPVIRLVDQPRYGQTAYGQLERARVEPGADEISGGPGALAQFHHPTARITAEDAIQDA